MKSPLPSIRSSVIFLCVASVPLFFAEENAGAEVIINEICANNEKILSDKEGDFPDWIELLNTGQDTVNLGGYCLSDEAGNPAKWCFPEYLLVPGEYLLVFASDKDIRSAPEYWNTIIEPGDEWKYLVPDQELQGDWRRPDFDDSSWQSGPTGIGYGDNDDATTIPSSVSLFMRKRFQVEDPTRISAAILQLDFDDGFVAYLNGTEIARKGMEGDAPGYSQLASISHEALMYGGGAPEAFELANPQEVFLPGQNVLAIQIHNVSATSSDMSAIPYLSLRSGGGPPFHPSPAVLNLSPTHFHTNFKLKAEQDLIMLTDNLGKLADSVSIPYLDANLSLGRKLPPDPEWVVFAYPTPGEANSTVYFEGSVRGIPEFSEPGGKFSAPFRLSLSAPGPGDTIYYTLDGSVPGQESPVYNTPLEITGGTVIRARILKAGLTPGRIVTRTFFSGPDNGLPAVCLSTDPYNLWDEDYGIYTEGPNSEPEFPHFSANYWQDWERPAHIEYYEAGEGGTGFSLDAGIKINGAWSRGFPQKSLAIYARRKYGAGQIEYRIFKDKAIDKFESIVLRNSGNDWVGQDAWGGTMFRDVLMTSLLGDLDVDHAASLQSAVYLNGEYWGLMNIREKINEHFVASNHGLAADRIDFLEGNQGVLAGSGEHYARLMDFLHANSIQNGENYEWVKEQMDIQNYINYQLSEIYFDNGDWPGNNIKYWRPSSAGGRWHWIVFDTDHGFGMWNPEKVYDNSLILAMEANGPEWPNPPWSTFLFRTLLQNREFRERFINSFADRINTSFRSDTVVALINRLSNNISEEMARHTGKWGQTTDDWNYQVSQLRRFANQRPAVMREQIRSTFGLVAEQKLVLALSDGSAGSIRLNSITIRDFPWEGIYFKAIPVELTALPEPGYRFKSWSGDISLSDAKIRVVPNTTIRLVANFEPSGGPGMSPVLINEISYMQDPVSGTGDWIELFNHSNQYIDLTGWILKDSDNGHTYKIRKGTVMEPNSYYVICRDLELFETQHPEVARAEGNFDFGFSSEGDMVRLYTSDSLPVDSVLYGIYAPWPNLPPGSGYTLALRDPDLDNSLAGSWSGSDQNLGTPGKVNFLDTGTGSVKAADAGDILLQNLPNPFLGETRIIFYSGRDQPVRVGVFDLSGRLIGIVADEWMNAGYHEFTWTPDFPGEGIFILKVETPRSVYVRKMLRLR